MDKGADKEHFRSPRLNFLTVAHTDIGQEHKQNPIHSDKEKNRLKYGICIK